MNNQIVWGLPHVFAIFLIVAASGVLNVSSIGSVFNKPAYCGGVIDMGYGKNNNKTGRNGMAAGFGGYSEK